MDSDHTAIRLRSTSPKSIGPKTTDPASPGSKSTGPESTGPKVIGIVGSYRKHGTIDAAVSEILEAAAQNGALTEKIYLQDQHIEFCTNCRHCLQIQGRGECVIKDDMASLLDRLEAADALVLGSPVNYGDVNALTRTFLERTTCYGYWPWDSPAPIRSTAKPTKKAVLVTSSAAPVFFARWVMRPIKTLKALANMLGAEPIGTLWIGMVNPKANTLELKHHQKARKLGRRLGAFSRRNYPVTPAPKPLGLIP